MLICHWLYFPSLCPIAMRLPLATHTEPWHILSGTYLRLKVISSLNSPSSEYLWIIWFFWVFPPNTIILPLYETPHRLDELLSIPLTGTLFQLASSQICRLSIETRAEFPLLYPWKQNAVFEGNKQLPGWLLVIFRGGSSFHLLRGIRYRLQMAKCSW